MGSKKTVKKDSSPTASADIKLFIKDSLEAHNNYRNLHRTGKLKLNSELCNIAQQWAERLSYSNNFEHSNNTYLNQSLGL